MFDMKHDDEVESRFCNFIPCNPTVTVPFDDVIDDCSGSSSISVHDDRFFRIVITINCEQT